MNLSSNKWRVDIASSIPIGWWIGFGNKMCDEIEAYLKKLPEAAIENFKIIEVKERYGQLHIDTNWSTKEFQDIIHKYKDISIHTCCACGAPATKISTSCIAPWCDEHSTSSTDIPINEYLIKSIKEV